MEISERLTITNTFVVLNKHIFYFIPTNNIGTIHAGPVKLNTWSHKLDLYTSIQHVEIVVVIITKGCITELMLLIYYNDIWDRKN